MLPRVIICEIIKWLNIIDLIRCWSWFNCWWNKFPYGRQFRVKMQEQIQYLTESENRLERYNIFGKDSAKNFLVMPLYQESQTILIWNCLSPHTMIVLYSAQYYQFNPFAVDENDFRLVKESSRYVSWSKIAISELMLPSPVIQLLLHDIVGWFSVVSVDGPKINLVATPG